MISNPEWRKPENLFTTTPFLPLKSHNTWYNKVLQIIYGSQAGNPTLLFGIFD